MSDKAHEAPGTSLAPGHLEGVEHHVGAHVGRYTPADDHPGEGVGDKAHVGHPGACRHVGEIGHPERVRGGGGEVPIDEVRRSLGVRVGPGGEDLAPAAAHAMNAELADETGHVVPADLVSGPLARLPELVGAIDLAVGGPEHEQDVLQYGVVNRPTRGLA